MAEYIDANKKVTIQVYDDMTEEWHKKKYTIAEVLDKWTDEGCPKPVETEPKHGRWKKWEGDVLTCSNCEHYWIQSGDQYDFNYCPNCGARMDEKE